MPCAWKDAAQDRSRTSLPYVLHDLIRAIYIEASDRSTGKRRQNIRIEYDGIGFIPINELIKEAAA